MNCKYRTVIVKINTVNLALKNCILSGFINHDHIIACESSDFVTVQIKLNPDMTSV